MGAETIILLGMGAGAILAGIAWKGVFTLPKYRISRIKILIALATMALMTLGLFAATGEQKPALDRFLGAGFEPLADLGGQLSAWIPDHQALLRQIGMGLAVLLGLWGVIKSRKQSRPLILILLALVFGLTGAFLLSKWYFTWAHILLGLGFVYAFAAGWRKEKTAPSPMSRTWETTQAGTGTPEKIWGAILLALVMLAAFALRIYQLGDISIRFDHYETDYAWQALKIMQGHHNPLLWTSTIWRGLGHYNFSPIYSYCVAGYFSLFGISLVALRLVPVTYGTVSVLTTYGIFNILFGKRLGLLAAFLMAVSPLAINYSRIGLLLCSTQTVSLLIVFFLLRALLQRSVTSYLLLAVACAFAGYFYSPAKYPILLASFLIVVFICLHRGYLRRGLPGLLLAIALIFVIGESLHIPVSEIMAPKFAGYESVWHRTQGHQYTPQADYLRGAPLVGENLQLLIRSFFYGREFNYDPWPRGNLFFGPAIPALVLLGIGFSLGRFRKINYRILLFFFAAFLIPNLLSRPPVMVRRMMVSWPFIFCLAAIPISQLIKQSRFALGKPGMSLVMFLVITGLGAHTAFNCHIFRDSKEHAGRWEDERHFDDYLLGLDSILQLQIVPISDLSRKTIDFRMLGPTGEKIRDYQYIRRENIAHFAREAAQSSRPIAIISAPGGVRSQEIRELAQQTGARLEQPQDPRGRRTAYALIYDHSGETDPDADATHPSQ